MIYNSNLLREQLVTYHSNLLTQTEPLTDAEKSDLGEWLKVLQNDVKNFGPTVEDVKRINAIRAKLAQ